MVPTQDPKVIVEIFQELFGQLFSDTEVTRNLSGINRLVMVKYSEPDVEMYLHLNDGGSKITFQQENSKSPDVTMEMKWETGHKLWSGNLDLLGALMTQKIKVKGEVDKLIGLRTVFSPATVIYKEIVASLVR